MNDVVLNKVKISKFKGEYIRVKRDRAYTHQEILRVYQIADQRIKICILLMCQSGLRVGAIQDLKLKHWNNITNKLIVYENYKEEYYTFVHPENAKLIKEYLKYRERFEKLTPESYLIRDHFNDFTKVARKPRQITSGTIRDIIYHLLKKSGVLTPEVPMTHGLRKFFTSELVASGAMTEYRWLMEGHNNLKANDRSYVKPTEEKLYQHYQKAIDLLTIDPTQRLQKRIQKLEVEKSEYEDLAEEIKLIKRKLASK